MASFEKMAKSLVEETTRSAASIEKLVQDTALLRTIITNQDIAIAQNKKIIDLLHQLNTALAVKA